MQTKLNVNILSNSRNINWEKIIIQCSRTELLLRNHLNNSTIRQYFPSITLMPEGSIVMRGGQIKVQPNAPCYKGYIADVPALPFYLQPGCEPTILSRFGMSQQVINGQPYMNAKFILLRVFSQQYSPRSFNQSMPFQSVDDFDIEAAKYIGTKFNITGKWNCASGDVGIWTESPPPSIHSSCEPASEIIKVYDSTYTFRYSLQIFNIIGGDYAVLPVKYFQHPIYACPLKLFLPPSSCIWTHSERLTIFPNATVVLTNDVMLAKNTYPTDEHVYLSNPGGKEWIDKIEIDSLTGRKIICLLRFDDLNDVQTMLALSSRLLSYGIKPSYAVDKEKNLYAGGTITVPVASIRSFIKEAQKIGAHIPEIIQLDRYGQVNPESFETSTHLLENLAVQGSITVVFEQAKVEPNLLSSRIYSGLSKNSQPFSEHCRNSLSGPISVVAFVDIENKRHYLDLNEFDSGDNQNVPDIYDVRFLRRPFDEGVTMFRNIINLTNVKAVLFDSEAIGEDKNIKLFKEVIRICLEKNIAVIVVTRNKKLSSRINGVERYAEVWKYGEKPRNHVVEIKHLYEDKSMYFEFYQEGKEWISKTQSFEFMTEIPGRTIDDELKPGIAPGFYDMQNQLTPDEMLGIKKGPSNSSFVDQRYKDDCIAVEVKSVGEKKMLTP